MKKNIFSFVMAAMAAVTIFASCDKNGEYNCAKSVETSTAIGQITFEGTDNNLFVVGPQALKKEIVLNTNLPCITSSLEYEAGHIGGGVGISFESADKSAVGTTTGRLTYVLDYGANDGNTFDVMYAMVQSAWNDSWVDYTVYGPIETPVCVRIRGQKGEQMLPLENPDKWDGNTNYYLKGIVMNISDVSTSVKEFTSLKAYGSIFRDQMHFTPSITSYEAQKVVLTVETANGPIDVTVYGKKRDGDIDKFLNYIKVSDNIEFPAKVGSKHDLEVRNLVEIMTCSVLKIE